MQSNPKLAAINVEAIFASGRRDTYSLHVADCHEYFANGVLVSNCYDMLRYSLMSRPILTERIENKWKYGTKEWAEREEKKILEEQEDEFNNKNKKEWWEAV